MKILLHSYFFWPSVGGLETTSHVLASGWSKAGHTVTVITQTQADSERQSCYSVKRWTGWRNAARLVRTHDLIFVNGSSTHLFPLAVLYRKPFVWKHGDYSLEWDNHQTWQNESSGSLTDLRKVFVSDPCRLIQVCGRRLVANFASANIEITKHMASVRHLPRQRVIYNPIDYGSFESLPLAEAAQKLFYPTYKFSFLGRLIKEKGVDDLLHALATLNTRRLAQTKEPFTLQIIGDGPERPLLHNLANMLGIASQVTWQGFRSGEDLVALVRSSGIFVIPSKYEEPMGNVALELMSVGKPLIVSQNGGLSECAADACLTFPNGDRKALAETMERLSEDFEKQRTMIELGFIRLQSLNPEKSIATYLELFESLLKSRA